MPNATSPALLIPAVQGIGWRSRKANIRRDVELHLEKYGAIYDFVGE
jgi:hypothetical protein